MSNVLDEITRRLAGASLTGSRNQLSAGELRQLALEYLDFYDEELARFPKLAGQSHWNLWMIDISTLDALFAVIVFRPDGLEFFCGTGSGVEIRRVSEQEAFDNSRDLFPEMGAKFRILEPALIMDRLSAEEWLGRTW